MPMQPAQASDWRLHPQLGRHFRIVQDRFGKGSLWRIHQGRSNTDTVVGQQYYQWDHIQGSCTPIKVESPNEGHQYAHGTLRIENGSDSDIAGISTTPRSLNHQDSTATYATSRPNIPGQEGTGTKEPWEYHHAQQSSYTISSQASPYSQSGRHIPSGQQVGYGQAYHIGVPHGQPDAVRYGQLQGYYPGSGQLTQ